MALLFLHLPHVWLWFRSAHLKSSSVNSSSVMSISSWISTRSISWNSSPPYLFFLSTVSFMISLTGSVMNPVKSCITSDQVSPVWIYCFRHDDFHSFFYNNDGIFHDVIFSDFHVVLYVEVFFCSTDSHFQTVPWIKSLKGPYDPLI